MGHVRDLANMVWLRAHLHDDDVAALHGLPSAEDRTRQGRLILDGYRLAARGRIGFVERMIEFAVRSAREEAVVCGVGPTTQNPAQNGFPTLGGHVAGAGGGMDARSSARTRSRFGTLTHSQAAPRRTRQPAP